MIESINLNLIPSGVSPVCHVSQYDAGRQIKINLFEGINPYTILSGDTFTLNVRKPDNTIVTTTVSGTQGNTYVTISTTEQIAAVVGENLCELKITNGSTVIGTLNFIMQVERDVLADGVPSQSVIEDLDERIAEAIGDNYYNKTETDALLNEKANANSVYTKTETDNLLDKKANIDGVYEDLTAGNADALLTDKYQEDKSPYNFRKSGGALTVGSREVDELIGGTLAFNQMLSGLVKSTTKDGLTITNNNDGSITISGTAESTDAVTLSNYVSVPRNNNIIFFNAVFSAALSNGNYAYFSGYGQLYSMTSRGLFFKRNDGTAWSGSFTLHYEQGTTINTRIWFNVHNLTAMFGSTIADYIYGLESATAGAGVAWFRELFPKSYYAYNAGELMSVKTSAHKTIGFNQFGNELEFGNIDNSGQDSGSLANYIRSKGYTKVIPNTSYCFYAATSQQFMQLYVIQYDANKNFISRNGIITGSTLYTERYQAYTLNKDTHYIRVFIYRSTVFSTVDGVKFCINLSLDGSRDGEYEPYKERTYPLDANLELRGIAKLDANNKLYYDGDTYESSGKVTRKYGIVNLGDLTWSYQSGDHSRFYATVNGIKNVPATDIGNLLCFPFVTDSINNIYSHINNRAVGVHNSNPQIWIYDSDYNDADVFKAAMNGVYLVYELATATSEEAASYQNPQVVNTYGTEEYIDNRAVAIPVGHNTKYLWDLKQKVEQLYGIPEAPTTNGNYKLVCTVSSGTPSYSWVLDT